MRIRRRVSTITSRNVLRRSEKKNANCSLKKEPIHVVNVLFCIIMIIITDVDEVIYYYYYYYYIVLLTYYLPTTYLR
jgi:hypothetical protein